jgi:hypothetical protein
VNSGFGFCSGHTFFLGICRIRWITLDSADESSEFNHSRAITLFRNPPEAGIVGGVQPTRNPPEAGIVGGVQGWG